MTISNEAVEKAAMAFFGAIALSKWEDLGPLTKAAYRAKARLALEAAAPIIRAECLAEAANEMDALDRVGDYQPSSCNDEENEAYEAYANSPDMATWLRARAVAERGRDT